MSFDQLDQYIGRQVHVIKHEYQRTNPLSGDEKTYVSYDLDDDLIHEIEQVSFDVGTKFFVMAHLPGWATTTEINLNRLNVFFTHTENDEFFIERFSIG